MSKLTRYHMSYHYRSSHTSWYPGCPEEVPVMSSSHLMRSPRNPTAREVPARGEKKVRRRGWKAESEQFPPNPAFTSLKKITWPASPWFLLFAPAPPLSAPSATHAYVKIKPHQPPLMTGFTRAYCTSRNKAAVGVFMELLKLPSIPLNTCKPESQGAHGVPEGRVLAAPASSPAPYFLHLARSHRALRLGTFPL